jgi:hypothetical protein
MCVTITGPTSVAHATYLMYKRTPLNQKCAVLHCSVPQLRHGRVLLDMLMPNLLFHVLPCDRHVQCDRWRARLCYARALELAFRRDGAAISASQSMWRLYYSCAWSPEAKEPCQALEGDVRVSCQRSGTNVDRLRWRPGRILIMQA